MNPLKKEKQAKVYMTAVSAAGWMTAAGAMFFAQIPEYFLLFIMMTVFLGFTEYFPLPLKKGNSSLSFPLVFTIDIVFGLPVLIVTYALTVLFVNKIQRRPFRILMFNPAQLVLSYVLARGILYLLIPAVEMNVAEPVVVLSIDVLLTVIFFYVINNTIVDTVLWLRPQPYPPAVWKQKFISESLSASVSLVYLLLMIFLGSQDRSQIDIFAAFFFFSPLVGFSLLSSSIAKLQREKNRLKSMFAFTKKLNSKILSKDWKGSLADHLQELIDAQALLLLSYKDNWELEFKKGLISNHDNGSFDSIENLEAIYVQADRSRETGALDDYFHSSIKSAVYVPLILDEECVGIMAAGRTRTHSFTEDDIRSIGTLANQLAVAIKTKMLIAENRERRILEERNRIAREIHDGVAQTVAGAVMNLETARKKFPDRPEETMAIVDKSLSGLRESLTEIRQSIYALRPKEVDRAGLEQAIRKRVEVLKEEQPFNIQFEVRGRPFSLSPEIEKMMFDTFQESVQNTIKHAGAANVTVLLSYQSRHVLLKIEDDGQGFSLYDAILKAGTEPHFGLISMNEEAEKIDASLQIDSKPGEGTSIILTIPIEKAEEDEND